MFLGYHTVSSLLEDYPSVLQVYLQLPRTGGEGITSKSEHVISVGRETSAETREAQGK